MSWGSSGVTLALGGGGARGFAHVGVMEALLEGGVKVNAIVGTSAGAIAGAGLALGATPGYMRRRVKEFAGSELAHDATLRALAGGEDNECRTISDRVGRLYCRGKVVKSLFMEPSILGAEFFKGMVEFFIPGIDFEDLEIPFASVATDIMTGEPVIFDHGPLRPAVVASCSVPGVAPPVQIKGRFLTDGGVASLVPADIARQRGAKRILAVSVERNIVTDAAPSSSLEYYLRAGEIQGSRLTRLQLRDADLVLYPNVGDSHWVDFHRHKFFVDQGKEAALACWPEIKQLTRPRCFRWFGPKASEGCMGA